MLKVQQKYKILGILHQLKLRNQDDLDFIVAVPQNATSNYIEEVTQGFNILNYPYIINGNLYAMLSSSKNPIYEFSK